MAITVQMNVAHANVADVEIGRADGRPCVAFAAAAHGGPERLWFCFRVRNGRALQRERGPITLLLKHAESMLGGQAPDRIQPVMRVGTGEWARLPPGKPAPTPDGRMGVWWQIDAPEVYADIAVCYPYGQPQVNALLAAAGGYYQAAAIGLSRGDRPIRRLGNADGEPGAGQPGIYLIARQHAGETPGSWVLDGLLRAFAQRPDNAPLIWCVPIADVDGVEAGDYGKDAPPCDLNRAWGIPPLRHEVMVMQRDAWRWAERCEPWLMLDFHAPGLCEADGLYVFTADDAGDDQEQWIERFRAALGPYASPDFRRVPNYPSRWTGLNATRFFRERIGCPAMTFESSYVRAGETVLSPEHYREAGARLAGAVAEALGQRGGRTIRNESSR